MQAGAELDGTVQHRGCLEALDDQLASLGLAELIEALSMPSAASSETEIIEL